MKREPLPPRVLAIDPTSRGFGFAVLEGPGHLVDWGIRWVRHKNPAVRLDAFNDLLRLYRPERLIVEDCSDGACRRRARARRFVAELVTVATTSDLAVSHVTIGSVHQLFASYGKPTKYNTAKMVAEYFPELAPRLPPKRKPWMSEVERMAIFDAVAFGLAYYFFENGQRK